MSDVVAVLSAEAAGNLLYGGGKEPDHKALTRALRDALDVARVDHDADEFAALLHATESALHRLVATQPCPNYGEATGSCDCLICRTQTVLTEWEDELAGELKERDDGE